MATLDCTVTQGGGDTGTPAYLGESAANPFDFSGGPRFFLFRPSLAGITPGSVIDAAEFFFWSNIAFGSQTVTAYQMLLAWVSGQTTGNEYSTGNAWATPGGIGSGDRSASSIGSVVVDGADDDVQKSFSIDPGLVQDWFDGAVVNNGLGLYGTSFAEFAGAADGTHPPFLRVTYTPPGGSALLLLSHYH